jgi:anti-sigma regulatory factor (Ser/Thr protein kinase)
MKFTEYLQEGKGDEKIAQSMADKAYDDVNADWDPPSKKQATMKEVAVNPVVHRSYVRAAVEFLENAIKIEIKNKGKIDVEDLNKIMESFKNKLKEVDLL